MRIEGEFAVNSIVLISTLPEEQAGSSRRLAEDLHALSVHPPEFNFFYAQISRVEDLRALLLDIRNRCRKGMRPIIHLDGHGCRTRGLEVGHPPQHVTWNELVKALRKINIATKNNLCTVLSACEGFHIIRPISFFKATPFYVLLAPQRKVNVGYLEAHVMPFYRRLLEGGSLDDAFKALDDQFTYFHAEKMLVISLAKYVKRHCVGRGGELRRERLLTEVFAGGIANTPDNRKMLRRSLKNGLRPSDIFIEKYGARFLFGRRCSITMDTILKELGITPGQTSAREQQP